MREVLNLRKNFEVAGIETYEADVPHTLRCAIDRFPTPWDKVPMRVCFFDIEVRDSLDVFNTPEPVVSISLYDSF